VPAYRLSPLLLLAPALAAAAPPRTLTLAEALGELERSSPASAQVASRIEEARAVATQAAAPLLPSLVAGGGWVKNSKELKLPRPGTFPLETIYIQPEEAFAASGTLRVPLLVPTGWADLAAARHAAAAAEAGAGGARLSLRTALVQGAWLAAAGEEAVAAAERALQTARDQARTARRAVDAGLQPPLAALQAETQAIRREGDLVRARAALERSQLALGVLLGRAERTRVSLPPPSPRTPVSGEEALRLRPEVRAAAEQVAAAESQRTSAWLRLAPQLAATGSAFAQDPPLPTGERRGWKATVDLTWVLYDGGARYGKRRQAEAQVAGARAAAEAQRLAVLEELEDASRDLEVSAERLRLAEKQRVVAADAAATARRGFEAGTTGNSDVLEANDQLFQAELLLADARARLGAAQAAHDRASGRL